MGTIEFVQYLVPSGQRLSYVDRPDVICEKARHLKERGCSLEIRRIGSRVRIRVSEREGRVVYQDSASNGPQVLEAIDRVLSAAVDVLEWNGEV
jgi:hypothetical protein